MSYSIVIPARYASTRLPAKPLRDIHGKPLVQHVFECAKKSGADDIIIATDDDRIAEVARGFGAPVCMTSVNCATGTDRLAEVVKQQGYDENRVVVNLQGDEPLMPPEVIDQVANNLLQRPAASVSTVCARVASAEELFDPNVVKVVFDAQGYALYFSRAPIPWNRDQFPTESLAANSPHFRHIGLYGYRAGFLGRFVTWPACVLETTESLEQLRVLFNGERIHVAEAIKRPGPGVDTEADLRAVQKILATA
ncbi:MAG: 3-deoxy-manno-octulosonate cytidylyltransferase [Gammaproteobacteria bacterium]|nr:3-deoxy-manno-octulosonate cytidylyltransferase [Gammaproteobacteria bacterium]